MSVLGKRSRDGPRELANIPTTPTKRRVVQLQTPQKSPTSHKRGLSTTSSISSTSSGNSPYSPAKSVLRRSATATIVGRSKESKAISEFVDCGRGVLYVCGPPGTGKSATVNQVTSSLTTDSSTTKQRYRTVCINCVSLKKPADVYSHALTEMGRDGSTLAEFKDCLESLDDQGIELVLVLDEIDYLTSNQSNVIYSMFELGMTANIKIIGIANALNLTDSILPHLRKSGIEPSILRFKPYSPAEITQILSSRVSEIQLPTATSKIVDKAALDFLGRKVANATGDIRKALDILRKSIESVESEYRSALSTLPVNSAEPKLASVSIRHISKVAGQALGGVTGSTVVGGLSIHEKAILCTMVVRKTETVTTTFDAYVALCHRDKMLSPLSRSEFSTVVSGMLDNSVLTHPTRTKQGVTRSPSKRSKTSTEEKLALGVSEMDVLKGIGEVGILKRFFDK